MYKRRDGNRSQFHRRPDDDKGRRDSNYYRYNQGSPDTVTLLGYFTWTVQDDLVIKVNVEQVPFFNAPIYTENKQQIGKIDEIFGNIRDYYVSVKLSENIKASSFEKDTKLYIDPAKLLPLQRFLPKSSSEQKRGNSANRIIKRGDRGRGRGGRGSSGGSRGSFGRGGFSNRSGNSGGFSGGRDRGGGGFNRNNSNAGRGKRRGRW